MAKFSDIIGHRQIIDHFQKAISQKRISHAYILNGEKGAGKKTLADAFSMTLQCESGQAEACLSCRSCKQAMSGNHPDIIRVTHEKPNTIGVGDVRSQLVNDISIKPYSSPYKVYIIEDADKLTAEAQNAVLKTLEEPPHYAVILLLTENAKGLLPTVLSRCVLLQLKPVEDSLIHGYLMENLSIPDYQADISVAFAQGNLGKAIQLASSEQFNEMKQSILQLLRTIQNMDINEVMDTVKDLSDYKLNIDNYLDLMKVWFRDVLFFKATKDMNGLIFREEINYISKQADKSSYEGLENIIHALETAKSRLHANVNFDLTMELLLFTIKEN